MTNSNQDTLKAKLSAETAEIAWSELQRFFARGLVIAVDESMDLVEVATQVASDNKNLVEQWTQSGALHPVSNDTARDWFEQQAFVWAVAVAPWVLVQALRNSDGKN